MSAIHPATDVAARTVTSAAVTRGVFALIVGCIIWRIPRTYQELDATFPTELAAQIPDPGVRALALRAGVLLGVLAVAVAMALMLAICRWLERSLFPASRSVRSARIGMFTAIVAVLVPPITLSGSGAVLRSSPSAQLIALAVVGLLVAAFARPLHLLSRGRAGVVVVVAALLALSLTANG